MLQKIKRNQIPVLTNKFQGGTPKVLCVCSAGCLRSPTAQWVLTRDPFGFNCRAVGIAEEYAIIPISHVLVAWADFIVTFNSNTVSQINEIQRDIYSYNGFDFKPIYDYGIEDDFDFLDPVLIREIHEKSLIFFDKILHKD